jgi:alpha-tubulin suppressor-like RCC1 family protein/competence protein ComGC
MRNDKMKKGISLIMLVITIIVIIILVGAVILGLTNNNPIDSAKYAVFSSDISTLEEQVALYSLDKFGEHPWINYIASEELNNIPSLKAEIAYYRTWKVEGARPTAAIDADNMVLDTPEGATDIYVLTNDINVPNKYQKYLYDAQTGIFYVYKGVEINSKLIHSKYAASEQNNIETALVPDFNVTPEAGNGGTGEGGGTVPDPVEVVINPGMNFELITNGSTQVFKLYENGDVYGRGIKGSELNTSSVEMDKIDVSTWQEFTVPSVIPSPKKVIPGTNTIYVIDGNDELWAWGSNNNNKLGLTDIQQVSYTGREPIKLNVDGKKVKVVYGYSANTFVITADNLLYCTGYNNDYRLGLGHNNTVSSFTKIDFNKVDKIKEIYIDVHGMTLIYCNDNTFYYSGSNTFGQLGNGTSGERYTTFTQIWNSGIADIDQDVDKVLADMASIIILKKDGTIWQAGYRYYAGGGDMTGNFAEFNQLPTTYSTNVKNIYQIYTARVILREVNGIQEVWVSPANCNNVGIDDIVLNSTNYYKLDLPQQLVNEGIKEILTNYNNVYYISNTGNVYASGVNNYLGLGTNKAKATTVIKLPLTNIDTVYNNSFIDIYPNICNTTGTVMLTGKDGKIYTTGNAMLLHYNKVLQNAWTKVASNVKYFSSGAYIDNNNDLWVSGPDSRALGLGQANIISVSNYVKVNDSNINGKAQQVQKADNLISVKTTDGNLYYSGLYDLNGGAPGWGDTSDRYNFVQLLTNVEENNLSYRSRFAVASGKLYGWGDVYYNALGLPKSVPTEITMNISLVNNMKEIISSGYDINIITKNGELWSAGSHPTSTNLGMSNSNNLVKHTFNFNNEKVVKIVNSSSRIVLTESGNLYGWGVKKYLGIGNTTDETITSPIKLDISGVTDIIGNGTMVIAKLSNGQVWATGSNNSGVLGKWVDKNGVYSKSDYETAFEWVRCTTLEK